MKVSKLWGKLKMRGLLLRGENANLVSWINQSVVDCVVLVEATTTKMNTTVSDMVMAAFTPGSYWGGGCTLR